MMSHWMTGANPVTGVLIRNLDTDSDAERQCHVTREAEVGGLCLQPGNTMGRWLSPEAGRGKKGSFSRDFGEHNPVNTLISDL